MILSLLQRAWKAKETRDRHRRERSGSMVLSAALSDELIARVTMTATAWSDARWSDALGSLAPIVALDRSADDGFEGRLNFENILDLVLLQKRLTNWCSEHRVAFDSGDFAFEHGRHTGRLRAVVRLAIGDRPPRFLIELGGSSFTFSIREAMADYDAMSVACDALLRSWGATPGTITPVANEGRRPNDDAIERELASACARGSSELLGCGSCSSQNTIAS